MEAGLIEFFNIVFRFIHIVAAIMWIGNSLLFTWMEINLLEEKDNDESLGYMNMLHGGGIFDHFVILPFDLGPIDDAGEDW